MSIWDLQFQLRYATENDIKERIDNIDERLDELDRERQRLVDKRDKLRQWMMIKRAYGSSSRDKISDYWWLAGRYPHK